MAFKKKMSGGAVGVKAKNNAKSEPRKMQGTGSIKAIELKPCQKLVIQKGPLK